MNYLEFFEAIRQIAHADVLPGDAKLFIKSEGIATDVAYRDVRRVYIDDEGCLIIETGDFYREEGDDD